MDGLLAAGAMVKARTWELIYRKFHVHVGKKICIPKHGSGCIRSTPKNWCLSTKSPSVQNIAGNWCQISIHPSIHLHGAASGIFFWHRPPTDSSPWNQGAQGCCSTTRPHCPRLQSTWSQTARRCWSLPYASGGYQDSSHQRGAGIGWTELQYVELMLDISYMDNYGYIMIYLISYIWICWILWILSIGINVWIYL